MNHDNCLRHGIKDEKGKKEQKGERKIMVNE